MSQINFKNGSIMSFVTSRQFGKSAYVNSRMYRELMLMTMPMKWLKLHGYL